MPYNEYEPLESVDAETGMLTDIDAIRELGLRIAQLAKSLVALPTTLMIFGQGGVLDMATAIISSEALLHVVSQADYYRKLGELLGDDPRHVEGMIRTLGLSETLPWTHPDAPVLPPELEPQIDLNDPRVQSSYVLTRIGIEQMARASRQLEQTDQPPEPPVELPASIDAFLKGLGLEGPESE